MGTGGARALKKVYSDALKEVSEYLLKNEEFDELQKLTSVASELYPFDEWQAVQMQALIGLERYKEAMKLYEQTSKHYFESLALHRARNWWSSTAIWEAAWAADTA